MFQQTSPGAVEAEKLKSYITRVESLEEDKRITAEEIKNVYAEAKSNGFDTKTIRQIIKLRSIKPNERTEAEYMLELYKRALGMDNNLNPEE